MKNLTKFGVIIAIGAVIVFGLSLAGCTAPVPIKSVKTPTINTSGIQRLAIKPFDNRTGTSSSLATQTTQYLTDKATQGVMSSGTFEIVALNDPNADGVFTGELRSIRSNDTSRQNERKDKDGNTYVETIYTREVIVEFMYSVNSTRTGMPVGTVNKRGTLSDSQTDSSRIAASQTLAQRIVDSQLRNLRQDIVPTIVSTNEYLKAETSKDKAVKERMKMAQSLVRSGNYAEAIKLYDEIGTDAARVNAGIIRKAIESDAAAQARLRELTSAGGLVEQAVKGSVDLLYSRMPASSSIIITRENTTSAERARLDDVVNRLNEAINRDRKLVVVDRSNQNLIAAEQQFQTSGNVDERTMVSIGKAIGARYIVFCSVSGQMSGRRFTVRIVSIETSAVIDQKSFDI